MELQKVLANSLADTLPANDPLVGQILEGKYELISRLGKGSMGTVYRARHLLLGRTVAVKVLRQECINDPIILERFHREACAAAQIDDSRVVRIFEYYDRRSQGLVFIAMELIEGSTLGALLDREGKLTPEQAVALMLEICAGVGAAHERGIVHRDLKPDNIMLPERNKCKDNETVKIVDFGICKLPDLAAEQILTQPGVMIGTPYYMPPEQCCGQALDVRADVYSLGAIIYEMLAGVPPFTGSSILDVLMKHIQEEPAPLTSRAGVAPELNAVIMRALAKDSSARQTDALDLAHELAKSVQQAALRQQRRWWQGVIHQLGIFFSFA